MQSSKRKEMGKRVRMGPKASENRVEFGRGQKEPLILVQCGQWHVEPAIYIKGSSSRWPWVVTRMVSWCNFNVLNIYKQLKRKQYYVHLSTKLGQTFSLLHILLSKKDVRICHEPTTMFSYSECACRYIFNQRFGPHYCYNIVWNLHDFILCFQSLDA